MAEQGQRKVQGQGQAKDERQGQRQAFPKASYTSFYADVLVFIFVIPKTATESSEQGISDKGQSLEAATGSANSMSEMRTTRTLGSRLPAEDFRHHQLQQEATSWRNSLAGMAELHLCGSGSIR